VFVVGVTLLKLLTFQHRDTSTLYFKWRHFNPTTLQPMISRRFNPHLFRHLSCSTHYCQT